MILKSQTSISFTDINPVDWVKVALFALLLAGIYYSAFAWLVIKDWSREDYNYGYLIPFVVLYLIWEKRKEIVDTPAKPTWVGIVILIPGIILFWLGELSGEFFSLYISFWLVLIGLCWVNLGWEKLKAIFFPLVVVLSMFPPPNFLHTKVTLKLKLISSQIGVDLMQLYGMSAYREGNIIDLGFIQLQVVDACSGLRFLFPLFVLGLLLAYFFKASFWKRFVLVISTIPITTITNSLRIALTGILYELWGPKVAEGFLHGFSGWFIFMTALGILLFIMWALSGFRSFKTFGVLGSSKQKSATDAPQYDSSYLRGRHRHAQKVEKDESGLPGAAEAPATSNLLPPLAKSLRSFFSPPQFVVAVILLGLTLVLSQGVEFRDKIPISKSFKEFPLKIGEWNGSRQSIEQIILDELDLSDYVTVNYEDGTGKWVNFYTAYYESQRKGESIHPPSTCLPGGGFTFQESGRTDIPVPNGDTGYMPVNRAYMLKNDFRQLSYYWFPQRGRILTNAYQLKIFAFWDALTKQRTDGALVRLITPVYPTEELADAEKRLQSFTQEIVPVLAEFLPE